MHYAAISVTPKPLLTSIAGSKWRSESRQLSRVGSMLTCRERLISEFESDERL